jgi:hypothetical protein
MKTFRSALLLVAVEYIVMKAIDFAEGYTNDNEQKVEKFVKDLIPGVEFDEIGWNIVRPLLPKVFAIARRVADRIDGNYEAMNLHMIALQEIAKEDLSA